MVVIPLLLWMFVSVSFATDEHIKQTPSKWTEGQIYTFEEPWNMDYNEPQFAVRNPISGAIVVPDFVQVITWDNLLPRVRPTMATEFPNDVRLELWNDDEPVTVICHSIPNIGSYNWVVRLPRGWSNEYWYHVRIYSVQDPHVFSKTPQFRITMPYGFYP